jgi:hypothetical protein
MISASKLRSMGMAHLAHKQSPAQSDKPSSPDASIDTLPMVSMMRRVPKHDPGGRV